MVDDVAEDVLGVLLAERAIRRKLMVGLRAIDRLDADLWRSMWHDGATLVDDVHARRGTAADFADQLTEDYARWAVHSHQITSSQVEVDGDTAVSESYVTAILRGVPDAAANSIDDHYRARYVDHWGKRDGRWAIVSRWVGKLHAWRQVVGPGRIGASNRRDNSDPSYAHLGSLGAEDRGGVDELLAERVIRRQMHNYCRGIDRFDVPLWQRAWHDGATLDYGDVGWGGLATDLAAEIPDHYPWASHSHTTTSSLINVSGDRAVSETYSSNILWAKLSESGELVDSHYRGRYLDRWSKRDGVWAMDHRSSISDLGWDQPCVGGVLGLRARRDDQDPSHRLFVQLLDG